MNASHAERTALGRRLRSPSVHTSRGSNRWRAWLGGLGPRLRGWLWMPILAKMVLWLGTFVGLSFIGSGAAARLVGTVPWWEAEPGTALGLPPDEPDGGEQGIPDDAPLEQCRRRDAGPPARDASAPGRTPPAVTDDGRVVLNVAAEPDLTRLPGIGPKRAQAIVELRERLGRFSRLEQLLRVRGIGRRTLRRLRPLLVLDPPAPPEHAQGEASTPPSAELAPPAPG